MSRFIRILLFSSALLLLIWYGNEKNPTLTLDMCLAYPEQYHGHSLQMATETTVLQVFSDRFTVRYLGKIVTVIGDTSGVRPGEFLSLIVVFDKSGRVELRAKHIALYRRWKIWVSVLPVMLFAFMFWRKYDFDWRSLQWREAGHA